MIKVENIKVYNIGRAVYSARNPLNSWNKSDGCHLVKTGKHYDLPWVKQCQ